MNVKEAVKKINSHRAECMVVIADLSGDDLDVYPITKARRSTLESMQQDQRFQARWVGNYTSVNWDQLNEDVRHTAAGLRDLVLAR